MVNFMAEIQIETEYENKLTLGNKAARIGWGLVRMLLFASTPRWGMFKWRAFLLRAFGAKIGHSYVRPSCRVWAPWNLEVGEETALDEGVFCYSVDSIKIGDSAVISREAFLCTASHDIHSPTRDLITAPIVIEDYAWVAARAFVGPGVTIGEGAVVGACAVVTKDVEPWTVVAGNPARFVKKRILNEAANATTGPDSGAKEL